MKKKALHKLSSMAPLLRLLLLLLLPLIFNPLPVRGNAELRALMEVKASLDPNAQVLTSWTTDGDPCTGRFEGLACNEHGKVANISLQGRGLSGTMPPAVAKLRCLSGLYLHYNNLKGEIPIEISNLTELEELYLNVNNLSGGIPMEIGAMASLQVLQLGYNQLSGSMPTELGLLKKLTFLSLQSNHLAGAIPASLGDLNQLQWLDLSFNKLFGSIPVKLSQLPQLVVLDVRNNTLSGSIPSDLKKLDERFQFENNSDLCGDGYATLRACTSADTMNPNSAMPREIPQSADFSVHCNLTHCKSSSKSPAVVVVVVTAAVALALMISGLLAFAWYRRRRKRVSDTLVVSGDRAPPELHQKNVSPLVSLEYSNAWDPFANSELLQSFRFNPEEVDIATQYFSEVNLLGRSSYAATYKGILRDGSVVAVKSINKTSCKLDESEFLKGLQMLTLLQHENLVPLRGICCSRGRGECSLIYDYVSNGSLSQYLDLKDDDDESGRVLDWPVRVSIIEGIAKGIEFLHDSRGNKPTVLNQNISADKILIDHRHNPRISCSGLHNLLVDDAVFSTLKTSAAMGYLAPEYTTTTGRFTKKSDVYAFGVVVLQILSGKRRTTQLLIAGESGDHLKDIMDVNLRGRYSMPEAAKLAEIAVVCSSESPDQRPTMEMVLQELRSIC